MFQTGQIDETLFIKKIEHDNLLVQIYVDDIIFDTTSESFCNDFSKRMHNEFEMSMMGEFWYFIGLQIHQAKEVSFINGAKYCKEVINMFDMEKVKIITNPMATHVT